MSSLPPLDIHSLHEAYRSGDLTPKQLVHQIHARIVASADSAIWINVFSLEELERFCEVLEHQSIEELPLFGVPFAIKDNIDVQGLPTTAACPDFSYEPNHSAHVVHQLMTAGAIPIGKTNMDQFATGLVGVRSPYGTPQNALHPDYIPGGSSSGSAVAVAEQFVSFALGTDTAGSGRIPAAFNNLVGHKPSKGLLSTSGIVPACRSLDCVSIFAHNAADAERVFCVSAYYDPEDPYARECTYLERIPLYGEEFVFGVPFGDQLEFFGNEESHDLFYAAVRKLQERGGIPLEIDFSPFIEAAKLLYEGPWVAERYIAIEDILQERPEILHSVTRSIIEGGALPSAVDAFKAEYQLKEHKRRADLTFDGVSFILTPTAGTTYTVDAVKADPVALNTNLGYYTNFMNLLDFAATAIPAGFYENGMPFGVTAFAPAFHDLPLLDLAAKFAKTLPETSNTDEQTDDQIPEDLVPVIVCGAHLEGQPLNWQLSERGGFPWKKTYTAPIYEFFALPPVGDTIPPRPGVKRVTDGGSSIYVEVWLLPIENFGSFVAAIPEPLGIGKVTLEDGVTQYPGFICEGFALENAQNISHLGDWRRFVAGE